MDIIRFLLKSENHRGNPICQITKTITVHPISISGEIAVKKIFKIGIDGAKNFNCVPLANQSKDTIDSEDEFTLDKGDIISVNTLGNCMLYAKVSVSNCK